MEKNKSRFENVETNPSASSKWRINWGTEGNKQVFKQIVFAVFFDTLIAIVMIVGSLYYIVGGGCR